MMIILTIKLVSGPNQITPLFLLFFCTPPSENHFFLLHLPFYIDYNRMIEKLAYFSDPNALSTFDSSCFDMVHEFVCVFT